MGAVAAFAGGMPVANAFSSGKVNLFVTEFDGSGAITFSTAAGLALSYPGAAVDVGADGSISVTATSVDANVEVVKIARNGAPRQ